MLIQDFAIVALSHAAMTDLLARRGDRLVRRAADSALRGTGVNAPFELEIGPLVTGPQSSLVPFQLRVDSVAVPHQVLFHHLDADLEFFALEPSVSQLRVQGSYGPTPPMGSSRVGHARVETTVRLLLQELGRNLEQGATLPSVTS